MPTGSGRRTDDGARAEVIRSAANPIVKYVRSLQRRSTRRRERAFVVEGVRAIADALAAGAVPTHLVVREGGPDPRELGIGPEGRVPVRVLAQPLFDALADTVHPQGVLAVFPIPELAVPPARAPLVVVVDGIRDPGNLGTLLRSAAAAGATAVYLSPGTVDPFNPKVVRAGMGAHFRLPILDLREEVADELRATTALRAVARVGDGPPHDALDWRQPATLIVTGETGEESGLAAELATASVSIPMARGIESLNAAVAAAVILFEAARQRRRGPQRNAVARGNPG